MEQFEPNFNPCKVEPNTHAWSTDESLPSNRSSLHPWFVVQHKINFQCNLSSLFVRACLMGFSRPDLWAQVSSLGWGGFLLKASREIIVLSCNTRFIKEHKPSNHIRARIKSHVYTTEWTVYHSTYHVKRDNKANTNVIYYNNDKNVWYSGSEVQNTIRLSEAEAGRHRDVDWETNT